MRLFISHKSEDKRAANELFKTLDAVPGVEVWLDIFELAAGDTLAEILPAIDESDAVLLLWSPAASESEWVRREFEHGRDNGIRVIPVLLDRSAPRDLEGLSDLLYVDFSDEVLGIGRLCVSYLAATALERHGHEAELRLLRHYDGYVAHGIRNILIKRSGIQEAAYWSTEAREALDRVGEAIDELLDDPDTDDYVVEVLDGLTDLVWAMQDRLEELLVRVEMEEALRAELSDVSDRELEHAAEAVVEYHVAAEYIFRKMGKHLPKYDLDDIYAILDEYLHTGEDLIPDQDLSYLGAQDDAWLVNNTAFRLIEAGLLPQDRFKVDWDEIIYSDWLTRLLIPPATLLQLESYLVQIVSQALGVDNLFTAELDYTPFVAEADGEIYFVMPDPA